MTDRAEAIAAVQRHLADGRVSAMISAKHLRALIAEPDERMVERVRSVLSTRGACVSRADIRAALAVIQGSDRHE